MKKALVINQFSGLVHEAICLQLRVQLLKIYLAEKKMKKRSESKD
jgi:hypothetical protein